MRTEVVFTLTGPDRVGLVEEVTRGLLALGGNVEVTRAARLGGAFSMLVLVTLPAENAEDAEEAFGELVAAGYKVTVTRAGADAAAAEPARERYSVRVEGADHEGIVHSIASGLAAQGVNIEGLETGTTPAPESGTPVFHLTAVVSVPPGLTYAEWTGALQRAADVAAVDVEVAPAG